MTVVNINKYFLRVHMKDLSQMNQLITTEDLTNTFKITAQTIRLWRKKGMPHIRIAWNAYRYDPKAVAIWIEKNMQRFGNSGGEK